MESSHCLRKRLVTSGGGLKRGKDFSMSSDFFKKKGGEGFSNDREGNLGFQKGLCVLLEGMLILSRDRWLP